MAKKALRFQGPESLILTRDLFLPLNPWVTANSVAKLSTVQHFFRLCVGTVPLQMDRLGRPAI